MKKRTLTRPGFSPATPELPDPVCARACGSCWACRRKAGGPLWFLSVVPDPKGRR